MQTRVLFLVALGALAACAAGPSAQPQEQAQPAAQATPRQAGNPSTPGCKFIYPVESRRAAEEGTVGLRVLVEPSGKASKTEVHRPSGFPRLDQAAVDYAQCLRFTPVKRNGVPITMWFDVPITFRLEKKD